MSKRNVVIAVFAVLLAVSSMAYAVLPQSQAAPADGQTFALFLDLSEEEPIDTPPTCPDPNNPGCSGG